MGAINKISIKGFKSIRELNNFELRPLNIIVGANGAGKSNLIQVFRMLLDMVKKRFQTYILENGGADAFPYNGLKTTPNIEISFEFKSDSKYADGPNFYSFKLLPTADEKFLIEELRRYADYALQSYGSPSEESRLYDYRNEKSFSGEGHGTGHYVYNAISNWMVYHFHDSSSTAPMRRSEIIEHCKGNNHNTR